MCHTKQLVLRPTPICSAIGRLLGLECPGVWFSALGLAICLLGCQPQASKAPELPPPVQVTAPLPRPVRPTFYVTVNQLRLRSCPGKDCPKTSTLALNTEVEKMGMVENWAQIKVKKDGTIGYVYSGFLSPQPVSVTKLAKKKPKQVKHHKATQPSETTKEEVAAQRQRQEEESSPPIPHAM